MSENGGDDERSEEGEDHSDDARDRRPVGDVSLSLDTTLKILADPDQRRIIGYLRDATDRSATVEELANHLVSKRAERAGERSDSGPEADQDSEDRDSEDSDRDSEDPERIRAMLHHTHVPELVDAGLIDYDARNEEIRYWGSERLERWHDRIRNRDD